MSDKLIEEQDMPRVCFHPEHLAIEGVIGDYLYIVGEYEDDNGDAQDCLIEVLRTEVFRVLEDWMSQKKRYDDRPEHTRKFLAAVIDPEETPALDFAVIAAPECRDGAYEYNFHVNAFDSPSLENG